nr:MAG TPA: hypothetical protein [Caudoviricetes sp.]
MKEQIKTMLNISCNNPSNQLNDTNIQMVSFEGRRSEIPIDKQNTIDKTVHAYSNICRQRK